MIGKLVGKSCGLGKVCMDSEWIVEEVFIDMLDVVFFFPALKRMYFSLNSRI